MQDTRRRLQENVDLMHDQIEADPAWITGMVKGDFDRAAAAMALPAAATMFWARGGQLIEATHALETLLTASDLGQDLPCDLLRPHKDALYIHFGPEFQRAMGPLAMPGGDSLRSLGVYVFEARRAEARALSLLVVYAPLETTAGQRMHYASGGLDLVISDESLSLNDLIEQVSGEQGNAAHYKAACQLMAKVLLYMAQPLAARKDEQPYTEAMQNLQRLGQRKAAKLERQVTRLYDRVLVGLDHLPVAPPQGHAHGELSPHLRRGHFRLQAHGPGQCLRKVIFVAPTWIRADKLAH